MVVSAMADLNNDDALRALVAALLGGGLPTEAWPRGETSEMVSAIVARLRRSESLDDKLVVAGFTDHTVEADGMPQPCETCMYYVRHRRFCELPELMLPVEPHWSCRLWRI